jgi:hypothetical protein
MADYEWVQPEQPARRGGIPWIWLFLGFVLLMMFLNSRAQQPPPQQQPDRPSGRGPLEPTQAQRPAPSRADGVQREGDWSLEEMPGRESQPTSTTAQPAESAAPAPPKKTAEGDWQIEEVSANGNVPRVTPPTTGKPADPAAPANKSTKGDWMIEEVKPDQASTPKRE